MIGTTLGQQGFELLEDGLDEVRWECGHGFSPSSGSLEDSPDDRASRVRFPSSGPSHLSAQALTYLITRVQDNKCSTQSTLSSPTPTAMARLIDTTSDTTQRATRRNSR